MSCTIRAPYVPLVPVTQQAAAHGGGFAPDILLRSQRALSGLLTSQGPVTGFVRGLNHDGTAVGVAVNDGRCDELL